MLELKLLADVGLLGFPNAGKTHAHLARVAGSAQDRRLPVHHPGPEPGGGSVQGRDVVRDGRHPGNHRGRRRGRRARSSVPEARRALPVARAPGGPVVPPARSAPRCATWTCWTTSSRAYSPELAKKPQIVAANKIDLPEARERLPEFESAMARRGVPVFPISAATGEGLGPLLDAVAQVLSGGALPMLGRAERPRRRPRARAGSSPDERGSRRPASAAGVEAPASVPSRQTPSAKSTTRATKQSNATNVRPSREDAARSPATRRGASSARTSGGGRKTTARPSRRPVRKGTR